MAQILKAKQGGDPLDTTGLCLLSLDGGGVRGLSTLYVLKGLMDQLNTQRKKDGLTPVKPCEVFDLIGGTSTGGLIAIMLGRLEMGVDDCITAYSKLMSSVFAKPSSWLPVSLTGNVKAQFDSKKLKSAVEDVINSSPAASATDLFNDGKDRGCHTFVCSVAKETTGITRLRSYSLPDEIGISATICEAALATSAASGFFDPVKIGNRQFVDGALGANNPLNEVESEASNIWTSGTGDLKPLVKCFISIGTGVPSKKAIEDNMVKLAKTLVSIATETENTESLFVARWAKHLDDGRYFRFNVNQGLQDVGLAEYQEQGKMEAATEEYLKHQAQKFLVRNCVQNLRMKECYTSMALVRAMIGWNHDRWRETQEIYHQQAMQKYYEVLDWVYNRGVGTVHPEQPYQGTDSWFLEDNRLQSWKTGDLKHLWCYGRQGCGKTVLAWAAFEQMRDTRTDNDDVAILMASCSFDSGETPSDIIANLLHQAARLPKSRHDTFTLSESLHKMYRELWLDKRQKALELDQLHDALHVELKRFRRTYIVIDGLDELPKGEHRSLLLDKMCVLSSEEGLASILAFSRDLPDIRNSMAHDSHRFHAMEVTPSRHLLLTYIEERINKDANLRGLLKPTQARALQLRAEVMDKVVANSAETYLLAKLHVEKLGDENEVQTRDDLRCVLNTLPDNFSKAYDAVFSRIEKNCGTGRLYRRVKQFLFLVTQAKEPLSVSAIEHAMAIASIGFQSDEDFLERVPDAIVPSQELASKCAGLVAIEEHTKSRLVRLTHKSIGEYLYKRLLSDYPKPDSFMAGLCLDYLRLPTFKEGAYTGDEAEEKAVERAEEYCFLKYSSLYWGDHTKAHEKELCENEDRCETEGLCGKVLDFVKENKLLSTAAQMLKLHDKSNCWDEDREITGVHICAYFGLTRVIGKLLVGDFAMHLNAKDKRGTTPLMYSVLGRHLETVSLLLDAGADASSVCRRGYTALHRVCLNFDKEIWERMATLDRDISVNEAITGPVLNNYTALAWAAFQNQTEALRLLLKREEINRTQGHILNFCVSQAAIRGYIEILQCLLDDAKLSVTRREQCEELLAKALIAALQTGNIKAAQILLEHGANPEWRDRFQATCIIRVVDSGNIESLKFIWDRVDRQAKDQFQRGVLHSGSMGNKEAMLRYLLEHDSSLDVNAQSDTGEVPLHEVSKEGDYVGLAKLLLDHGANPNIQDNKGQSPIDVAKFYRRKRLLALYGGPSLSHSSLLSQYISPEILMGSVSSDDSDEETLLHLKRFTGRLSDACNRVEQYGGPRPGIQPDTPLIIAIIKRKLRCASFLLQEGANVHGKDRFFMTALHWAARFGDRDLILDLLGRGANTSSTYPSGGTSVEEAAENGYLDLAILMLNNGHADNAKSIKPSWMPVLLGQACDLGDEVVVKKLVDAGAPLNVKDDQGRTPRQRARMNQHDNIVAFLDRLE